MKEKATGSVKLQDENLTTVKTVVEYIYSGAITLTETNVQWLNKKCQAFLKCNVKLTNCFEVRNVAGKKSREFLQIISCYKYLLSFRYALL